MTVPARPDFVVTLSGVALALCAMVSSAYADPWIPAAGNGVVKPMVRLFDSSSAYSASGFTTGTIPASTQQETQFRVTGSAGIGDGFSIEYDLRAGRLRSARIKHHRSIAQSGSGLEDQTIGLNYGLTQTRDFADSVTMNVVLPTGSTSAAPALGTGHFALEPDVQAGVIDGRFSATIAAGARIFPDSGVTQLRSTVYAGLRVWPRLSVFATGFVSRTIQQPKALRLTDQAEVYNIVRVGAGMTYRLSTMLRPFFEYESTIAGQGIHAGRRIVVGVAIRY
ncbi:hypothetical protein AruPA_08420 [Acidiphilium sp. PA]|uniref:hypothetical protein n=1 Tax=Acidiphilium sp. PA TaxID=2871705 RepID=UPI0022447B99|nr:hypothetical protein [Acidiphilium sp. PA]MCW8307057.1 hypothetical protein [Acidiphilium sp. PA]